MVWNAEKSNKLWTSYVKEPKIGIAWRETRTMLLLFLRSDPVVIPISPGPHFHVERG